MAPHGHVWVPGGIGPYWRPYYNGRWTWLSLCGWTWIPYESWGWSTHHFGRWHWRYSLGWYWIPTRVWGPAWVSWYWGYDYFGWAPLSYYGYPGVIINNVYNGRFQGRYYPYNSRTLTVIHKNQLKARNVSKVALSQKSVKSLGKISLSRQRLPMRPTTSKISVERLGGKKVLLRKKVTSPESEATKRSSRTTVRKTEAVDSNRVGKKTAARVYPSQERKVVKEKSIYKSRSSVKKDSYGYPSSRKVSAKKSIYKSRSSVKKDSYGYPSSRKASANKPSKKIIPKKSSSFIGRIYKNISGSSKSVKSRSSQSSSRGTSSKKASSSSSRSKSSSSKASKKSSSSSSRSASKSSKVKKKN